MTVIKWIAVGIGSFVVIFGCILGILGLALGKAAARGDRMMEEVMRRKKEEGK